MTSPLDEPVPSETDVSRASARSALRQPPEVVLAAPESLRTLKCKGTDTSLSSQAMGQDQCGVHVEYSGGRCVS
jgi:hypothetical protein